MVRNLHQLREPAPTRHYCAILLQNCLFCLICAIAAPQGGFAIESNVQSMHYEQILCDGLAILYNYTAAKARNRPISYSDFSAIAAMPLGGALAKNRSNMSTTEKCTHVTYCRQKACVCGISPL